MSSDYSRNFEAAMKFIFKWEGGYVNDPDDPGGETKWGISKRSYPGVDIKNLTKDQAKEIYRRDYWDKADLERYPQDKAIVLMNVAVNMGVGRVAKFAEKDDYRAAIAAILAYYDSLIAKNPKLAKYRKGWVNRTNDLETYLTIE